MCSAKFRRPKPTPLRSFLGALAALLLSSACADENTRLLRAGDASYRSGNYVEARLSYRRATQSNSQLTEAYYRLGLTEQKLQNMRAAFLALVQASRLAPARDDIKIALADVCIAGLTYDPSRPAELRDTALRMADEILVKDPKSPAALRIKGSLALLGNSPADAVNYFKAARQQRPDDANLTVRLIESLVLSGSGREAEQLATQHIALHKGDGDVYDAIFAYYSQQNRTNEAERTLKLKISNNPGEPAYVTKLASFYWRLGRQDQALDLVTRMLARPARPAAAHLAAGDFYHSIGRLEEAKQQFEEGLHAGKGQEIPFQERIMKISLAQGNSDQAALLADQILKEDPQNSEALPIRAALRVKSGQPNALAGAIEDYKLLLRKNGRDPETHYAFGRALQLKGDLASAKAEINEAIRLNWKSASPRLALAEIAIAQHNWQEALAFTQKVLSEEPRNPRAGLLKAQALCDGGRYSEGRSVLEQLIEHAPDDKAAYLQLALLEIDQREFSRAESAFARLQILEIGDLSSTSPDPDVSHGELDRASAVLKKELERSPNHPVVHDLLASVAVQARQYDRAISEYHALLLINPNNSITHLRMAQVFQLKGDLNNSISTLERAQKLFPGDFSLTSQLAYALQSADRQDEAIRQFRRALDLRADEPRMLNSLASALIEANGNLDEALRLAQRAVQKSPQHAQYLDTLGWIYLKKNMTDNAISLLSDLVKKYPDDPTFRYHLGAALFQKGDRPAARQALLIALSDKPPKESIERIRELLGKLN